MIRRKKYLNKRIVILPTAVVFTLAVMFTGCGEANTENSKAVYKITEEGINFKMQNTPISSYWLPEDLLGWNVSEDKDAPYNVSTIELQKRVDKEKLQTVNETQNKDTKVVALSIMNANTSGNPTQGSNTFNSNTFSYWQYIDTLVYWGGSAGEGIIVPPSADVTDSAHKNGVEVLGTIFFPPTEFAGRLDWLDTFFTKDSNGNFVMVDKLIEVAKTYKFEGWFINQETQGTEENPLTAEYVPLMQEFIKQYKEKAGDSQQLMWYDSMTKDGEIDWQNTLNDKNDIFLIDGEGNKVADSMFLNFWWTEDKYAQNELLKKAEEHANQMGFDSKEIYAGIDVQANGTATPIKWDLFEKSENETHTSLGLYCPSWTYFSSDTVDSFQEKEAKLWVNEFNNPSKATEATGTTWRGISTYVVEKSAVTSLPFKTNFSMGNGYNFFIDGEKVSALDWNNRSLADVMPTYRWIIENEGENQLTPSLDYSTAYYGGNSIKLLGKLEANKPSTIKLFSADLKLEKGVEFTTMAKADSEVKLDLVLEFDDGTVETISGDKSLENEWTKITYDVEKFMGKSIRTISYKMISNETLNNVAINLGNLSIDDGKIDKAVDVSNLNVESTSFEEDSTLAGIRLTWDSTEGEGEHHYEIYKVNSDKSKSYLGSTYNNRYFINSLERETDEMESTFEVVSVNNDNVRGKSANVKVEWPDNTLPKANFRAKSTVIAPGESVTFENLSNLVSDNYEWKFEGADVETSTEQNPTVTYSNEGTYDVVLKAKNKKGDDEIVINDLITVTSSAKSGLVNFSVNKAVEASSFVNDAEAPKYALDGDSSTKWCAVGPDKHNITIDLGEVKQINEVRIQHAEMGGENPDMNTEEYMIEVSEDGQNFTTVSLREGNALGETVDSFKQVNARYVKLTVLKATQGSDSAARIYGIDVFGLE